MDADEAEWAQLEPELDRALALAGARYDEVLSEFCNEFAIADVDAVLDTGVMLVNNVELTLVPGALADPWMLQIIIDLGEPEGDDLGAYYRALLSTNMAMVGTHSFFAVNPDNGHGLLIGQMSMHDASFNAAALADYLHLLTVSYEENRDKTVSQAHFDVSVLLA
ncbi:MAG: hypothetical protein V4623_01515 [Pseudomonadota bacterium]